MFNQSKREFLFKCDECQMILSVSLEEEDDLKKVQDGEMVLKCLCDGNCYILRD